MSSAKSTKSAKLPESHGPAPCANTRLIGHAAAEARFLEAFNSGRLPHSWLISGPRGVGKATLGYRIARFLLSQGRTAAQGGLGFGAPGLFGEASEGLSVPENSEAFHLVASASHPDLRVLERITEESGKTQQAISVDSVRKALGLARLTPALSDWRVILVDAADDLNRNAANALLKALEEPPKNLLFLVLTHAPGRLLPTIRSRCCHLPLAPLSHEAVVSLLADYAPEIPPAEADGLTVLAEGSIGRALDLWEQGGLDLYKDLIALLSTLPGLDAGLLQGFADRIARDRSGASFRTANGLLLWWLARLTRAAAIGQAPAEIVPGEAALLGRLGGATVKPASLARFAGLWEKLHELFGRAEAVNLDRRQVITTAFQELRALTL